MPNSAPITICGAGPAGLSAAITLRLLGLHPVVYERGPTVGARFHGDFQGIENWTTQPDVLEEFRQLGLDLSAAGLPIHKVTCFSPSGRMMELTSHQPFLYLVRRGPSPGTLDSHLLHIALTLGVEVRFGQRCEPVSSPAILAHGPTRPRILALGYTISTDAPDGVFAVLDNDIAPGGYAYLLIHGGKGTLAVCLFSGFAQAREFLERAVGFFSRHAPCSMVNATLFGGTGAYALPASTAAGFLLRVGECAGFQDACWGFGLRYAILSGILAARSLGEGSPDSYDVAWRARLAPLVRSALVNRLFYNPFGSFSYRWFLWRLARSADVRDTLRRYYAPAWWKNLLVPIACAALKVRPTFPETGIEPWSVTPEQMPHGST
jgi:flavin-dependent dehydrogenase